MIAKISNFVKMKFRDIILAIIIGLLVLLAFALGFITAKYQQKQPIQIEEQQITYTNIYEKHTAAYSFIS